MSTEQFIIMLTSLLSLSDCTDVGAYQWEASYSCLTVICAIFVPTWSMIMDKTGCGQTAHSELKVELKNKRGTHFLEIWPLFLNQRFKQDHVKQWHLLKRATVTVRYHFNYGEKLWRLKRITLTITVFSFKTKIYLISICKA